jgi:arabinose-5-phosphate isomerase
MTAQHAPPVAFNTSRALDTGRAVLEAESAAVAALARRLDQRFTDAVEAILRARGRVVLLGVGKSGHVAHKIAATLASTGTPAFYVHASEASHGDLGMITPQDLVIALSNSGESAEIVALLPLLKRAGCLVIAITGKLDSTLARHADVCLDAGVEREAGPLGLAPTSSTTAALALGDALALALLEARGFSAEDFARSHPGGSLGRRLLVRVRDVMRQGEAVPQVPHDALLADALLEMSRKVMGMTAVIDHERHVLGIFTDGDLRRALANEVDIHRTVIAAVMHRDPHLIDADKLAAEAVQHMQRYKINQILVADPAGRLIGALNTHDLFRAGVL